MNASLLLWLALLLPGYVVIRRLSGDDLKSGLMGTLGLSYVAVLGLLSPVSILCYLLEAPLGVFSLAAAALLLAGVIELTRQRWWRDLGKLIAAAASIELLIILADVALGARVGAHLDGDTRVHLARVRFLVDHGFSNCDPFVAGSFFFPIYHTNILHAVYAACSQIMGVDHFGVWYASLVWGKLMIASGMYFLVWCIFERSWPAWLAAVCMVGAFGPVNFIVYPNKLAPLWLIPCMMAFAVQALTAPWTWRCAVKLGALALVLGQVHGLYTVIVLLGVAPVIGVVGLFKVARRRPGGWRVLACALVLLSGLPFPLVSKLKTPAPAGAPGQAKAAARAPTPPGFIEFGDGWTMRSPRRGFSAGGLRVFLLALGIAGALATSRRRQAGVVVGVAGAIAMILYVPPIFTAVLAAVGQHWIISRFEILLRLALIALLIPTLAWWLEPKLRWPVVRGLVAVGVFFLAIAASDYTRMHNWTVYRQRALAGSKERLAKLQRMRDFRAVFVEFVPPGETVLSTLEAGMSAVMLHDCHIVVGARANNGVPDAAQRRRDVRTMLAEDTSWPQRRALLQQYGHDDYIYFWPSGLSTVPEWARVRTRQWRDQHNLWLMRVTID
jgi:hypothetical protein